MEWVRVAPERRALIAAHLGRVVSLQNGTPRWTELADGLLATPEADAGVARALMCRFWPMHWTNFSGLVRRRPLIEQFGSHDSARVRAAAPELLAEFDRWIAEGEREVRRDDESFE